MKEIENGQQVIDLDRSSPPDIDFEQAKKIELFEQKLRMQNWIYATVLFPELITGRELPDWLRKK